MGGRCKDFGSMCRQNLVPVPRRRGGVEIPGTMFGGGGGGDFMSCLLRVGRFQCLSIWRRIE